jgi:hypothetical protein
LDVILAMIGGSDSNDVECHDALRMLAALLSHRKFALVFIDAGGVDRLMPLPKMRCKTPNSKPFIDAGGVDRLMPLPKMRCKTPNSKP